jgi:hypothetical protein
MKRAPMGSTSWGLKKPIKEVTIRTQKFKIIRALSAQRTGGAEKFAFSVLRGRLWV